MARVHWMMALLTAGLLAGCTPDRDAAEGEGAPPPEEVSADAMADWTVRLDDVGQEQAGFQMIAAEDGFRVTTGPAGIAWRAVDLVEQGDFTASATFTEADSPAGHREAYGLLVGGKHLDSPDLEYTYFLVRGNGQYLVKRREGTATIELTNWRSSPDLQAVESGADATNRLSVQVQGDSVRFAVNGTTVETFPAEAVKPWGLAGVRVNHRLDVRVEDWEVSSGVSRPGAASSGESPS